MPLKLSQAVGFDPDDDLRRIAEHAAMLRSLFRPAKVEASPAYFTARMAELERAEGLRLYLVTTPARPVALAVLQPLSQADAMELLALAPGEDVVRPFEQTPGQRRAMMQGAPHAPSGRGVYPFLLGGESGMAYVHLEPEGLVLAMARWGHLNLLDPAPLLAQRMARLSQRLGRMEPEEEDR